MWTWGKIPRHKAQINWANLINSEKLTELFNIQKQQADMIKTLMSEMSSMKQTVSQMYAPCYENI